MRRIGVHHDASARAKMQAMETIRRAQDHWLFRFAPALIWTAFMTIGLLQPSKDPLIGAPPPENYPWLYEVFLTAMHFAAFTGFSVLWTWALSAAMPAPRALRVTILAALVYGLSTELLQNLVPDRGFQWADIAVNAFAVLAGAWLTQRFGWRRRPDRWLTAAALLALAASACTVPSVIVPLMTPDRGFGQALPDLVPDYAWQTLDPDVRCMVPGIRSGTVVGVTNQGDADAGPFTITVIIGSHPEAPRFEQRVDGLPAGDSRRVLVGSGWSMDGTTVLIDAVDEVSETNEDNNTLTQRLPMPTPYVACTPEP
jgi:VanZ family protein